MLQRQFQMWLGIALICLVLIATGCLVYGYCLRRHARALLDDASALAAAPDREAALSALRKKYGGKLVLDGCERDFCDYHLTLSNHLWAALVGAPYTELNVSFLLRGKLVSLVGVEYRSAFSDRTSPVVHI
jgi:hypothetical protein